MEFLQHAKFSSRQEKTQRRFVRFLPQEFFFNKKRKRKKKALLFLSARESQVLSQCRKTELQWNDDAANRSRETAAESAEA